MRPEERLRRLARDEPWADNPVRPLRYPPSPRPRFRLLSLLAAAAATVVVGGTAGTAAMLRHREATAAPDASQASVAWKALPATASQTPATLPTCAVGALTAEGLAPEIVMGTYRTKIIVSNSGPDCSLPDSGINLVATSEANGVEVLAEPTSGRAGDLPTVVTNSTVAYYVGFGACPASQGSGSWGLALRLEGTDIRVAGASLADSLAHCASVTLDAPPTSVADVNPYPGLTAALNLPKQVAGSTLEYSVTLTNTTAKVVHLGNCPTYRQTVNVGGHQPRSTTYRLNCDGADSIAPHGSRTFEMRAPLPASNGPTKVGWAIGTGGPSAGGSTYVQ